MKIYYAPTYELKNDLGFSSPCGIVINSIDALKDKISFDAQQDNYKIASLDIFFDNIVKIYFDSSGILKIYYHFVNGEYLLAKFDNYSLFDLIKNIEDVMVYDYI